MIIDINWWELDDNEIFLIENKYCDFIINQIKSKYKNINSLRLKLGIGVGIYQLKYKRQGINNLHLKKIMKNIRLDFLELNDKFTGIGRFVKRESNAW